jgi:hypothetical protein
MWMLQFEHGIFRLAFDEEGPDTPALKRFVIAEMRRFIREEAGA